MSLSLDDLKPFLPGLEELLDDMDVLELMINAPGSVWVERAGQDLAPYPAPALDAEELHRAAIHIARPLGLDPKADPLIDARLEDGSRVAICVAPATPTAAITIRRFGTRRFTADDLVELGSVTANQVELIRNTLLDRKNVLVSGGTGSGKTTLLNALIELLPPDDRIVAIEDTLELHITHENCVRFEARELGQDSVSIRDLVRHALRHRPDHIVVGEVRGAEAADLLQALNTGHGGSLTTIHANNAVSALSRLASCAMQAGGLPWEVVCRSIVDGISLVVHTSRIGGRRAVEEVRELRNWRVEDNAWITEAHTEADDAGAVWPQTYLPASWRTNHAPQERRETMKTRLVEGVPVLEPKTSEELTEAVNSGRPFVAPDNLAGDFALPTDAHVVDGEDVGVLEDPAEQE